MKSISSANHPAIRVQSILRHCDLAAITRSLEYVDNAARNARAQGTVSQVEVVYGQCSGEPALDAETLGQFRRACPNLTRIDCTFFGDFLAYADAHNRLLAKNDSDYTLIMDPEALAFPDLFGELLVALAEPGVGLAEARQIPIEHPKDYDQLTGETSWASSVCAMAPTRVFDKVSGFDSESFSFCLADVDFSWRVLRRIEVELDQVRD